MKFYIFDVYHKWIKTAIFFNLLVSTDWDGPLLIALELQDVSLLLSYQSWRKITSKNDDWINTLSWNCTHVIYILAAISKYHPILLNEYVSVFQITKKTNRAFLRISKLFIYSAILLKSFSLIISTVSLFLGRKVKCVGIT